jgi:hypothetical protein
MLKICHATASMQSSRPRRSRGAVLEARGSRRIGSAVAAIAVAAAVSLALAAPAGALPFTPFLAQFNAPIKVASTVPANGDVNPYGIVNVPQSTGALVQGDTLVSNFNAKSNLQGTGTTIVQISPGGQQTVFAQLHHLPGSCPGGIGLTTALTVLQGGFVVVGSLPVTDKGNGTPEAGCLIVINSFGQPVETWSGPLINGPWDMTALQGPGFAQLFVTNVLNGTVAANGNVVYGGTVVRIDVALPSYGLPVMVDSKVIAAGFPEQLNQSALVLGPTGVALGQNGTLYVADTVKSRIQAIPFAPQLNFPLFGDGFTLTSGYSLEGPLGMTLAPNGDIIVVNGGNGNAVEITPQGFQIDTVTIDPLNSGGDLFGVTIAPHDRGLLFVDDGNNTLQLFTHM